LRKKSSENGLDIDKRGCPESFDFLIPYGNYMKEKTRRYKKDIRHASTGRMKHRMNGSFAPMAATFVLRNTRRKRALLVWSKALRFMNVKIAGIVH